VSDRPGRVVELRPAGERFHTQTGGLDSWHSFSFGAHHDSANTHHGLLIAHNDDHLGPGAGFASHPHREMEVVTWVLSGVLRHEDSTGRPATIYPGLAQRMSAGRGIEHSEANASPDDAPVHFVQMWVPPDERGGAPGYAQAEVDPAALAGALQPIASGLAKHRGNTAISLNNAGAAMLATTLAPGRSVVLPDAPYLHLFVAAGTVEVEAVGCLADGDAVRFTDGGGNRVTAVKPAHLIVWEMYGDAFR
jgi:quercetin 2,3-dioxygenase